MSTGPRASDLLFVYGTLLRDEPNHRLIEQLGDSVEFVRDAIVSGALIDLGGCPGFCHREGSVRGEIYRVTHPRAWLALDRLESFRPHDPGRSLYIRERITPEGGDESVWIYRINMDPHGRPLVANGDWRAHAAEWRKRWEMQERREPERRFVVEPGGVATPAPSQKDEVEAALALVGALDEEIPVPVERAARRAHLSKMEALRAVQLLRRIGWITTKNGSDGPARDSRTTVGLVLTPAATAALSEWATQPVTDTTPGSREGGIVR